MLQTTGLCFKRVLANFHSSVGQVSSKGWGRVSNTSVFKGLKNGGFFTGTPEPGLEGSPQRFCTLEGGQDTPRSILGGCLPCFLKAWSLCTTIVWESWGGVPSFSNQEGLCVAPATSLLEALRGLGRGRFFQSRKNPQCWEGASLGIPKLICFSIWPAVEVRYVPIVPTCQNLHHPPSSPILFKD